MFDEVLRVGAERGREREAREDLVALRERYWRAVDYVNPYVHGDEVVFLGAIDPLVVGGLWIPQLIEAAGGRHSINAAGAESRPVEPDEIVAVQPQRVIVCPRGLDLASTRRTLPALAESSWWRTLPAVRNGLVVLVDGDRMFHRPDPDLVDAFRWLVAWINDRPEVLPPSFPAEPPEPAPGESAESRLPRE
ncbi:MAG: ABC transporter substrate-binding protein [Planctomycetota bacterium]